MTSGSPTRPTRLAGAIAAACAAMFSGGALAQAALPEVQVTGTGIRETALSPVYGMVAKQSATGLKTDTSILEAPQSVSVVTREQIELQGATGIDEAVRYTSGTVGGAFGADPRSDWILVRGFRPALFLDGLGLPDGTWAAQTRLEPFALERIEVLKGPASVIYGALPPSGFVNGVSKRPTPDTIREIGVEFGNDDRKQLTLDFGGKLTADGGVLYRVTALARDSSMNVDHGKDQRYMIAPSFTFKLGNATSLTVLSQFQHASTRPVTGFLPAQGTRLPNPNGTIPDNRDTGEPGYDKYVKDTATVGYELTHKFDANTQFRQNLRYMDFDIDHRLVGAFGLQADLRTLNRYIWTPREHSKSFAVDNQIESVLKTGPVSHTLLAGLDYRRVRTESRSTFDFSAPTLDIFEPVYGATIVSPADTSHTVQTQSQLGLYLQDQARFDKFVVTASARHDTVKTDTDDELASTSQSQRDRRTSGRLGVNYVFDSGFAPYASWSTSFQPAIGTDFFGNAFKPTTGEQFEAGLKYRPNNGRALYTAAVFQLEQKNVLTPDPDPTHGFKSVQQGKIRSRGVELEGRFEVARNLDVIASYTYTDAKVVETTDPTTLDKQVPLQPRNQAQVWVDYRFAEEVLPGAGVGGGARYVGSSYGDGANTENLRSDATTLWDAQAHYDIGNWRLLATMQNVFNKQYIATCQSNIWCFYGYPRTFALSARYSW